MTYKYILRNIDADLYYRVDNNWMVDKEDASCVTVSDALVLFWKYKKENPDINFELIGVYDDTDK